MFLATSLDNIYMELYDKKLSGIAKVRPRTSLLIVDSETFGHIYIFFRMGQKIITQIFEEFRTYLAVASCAPRPSAGSSVCPVCAPERCKWAPCPTVP